MNRAIQIVLMGMFLTAIGSLMECVQHSEESAQTSAKKNQIKSIAVLPFSYANNDSASQYFRNGISQDVLQALSGIKGLEVRAGASSFQLANSNKKDAARKLNANALIDGKIQIDGDRIMIRVNLINPEDGSNLWSRMFDERSADISVLHHKIANAISEELAMPLGSEYIYDKIIDREAYELYLRGRTSMMTKTAADLKKSIEYFKQSLKISPDFSQAYVGIADCYNALGYASILSPKESFPLAYEAAMKALQIDPTMAEPHAALGFFYFYHSWDWAMAEEEFRKAIGQNPNYHLGYEWYAFFLTAMERYEEAASMLHKARELDPLSVAIITDMGFSSYYNGDYELAQTQLQQALETNENFAPAHLWKGRVYQEQKSYREAVDEYENAIALSNGWPVAFAALGNVSGRMGDYATARTVLDKLTTLRTNKFVTAYGMALVYDGLGEKESAIKWLNSAYEERSQWLVWLKTDPRWNAIREDKRFSQLIERVGLPH